MSIRYTKAIMIAKKVIETLLETREGERILFIGDDRSMLENEEVVYSLMGVARSAGAETVLTLMSDREPGAETIPEGIEKAMEGVDIVIAMTRTTGAPVRNPTILRLRKLGKIRVATMVKRTWEDLTGPALLEADYNGMRKIGEKIAKFVDSGRKIHVVSRLGTDFTSTLEGKKSRITDFANEPGKYTEVPWGEVDVGPAEGTSEGIVFIDGPLTHFGQGAQSLTLTINRNRIIDVRGSKPISSELSTIMRTVKNADNVAEIGFGINPLARLRGSIQEDKKKLGTLHIGVGDGTFYGQTISSASHIDCLITEPTVEIDGHLIIKEGRLEI